MTKATEDQLSLLHKRVAETMIAALDQSATALLLLDEYRDKLPAKVVDFIEECAEVSPSLLTSATKFLKDNNISVDMDQNGELSDLQEKLKEKRTKLRSIPVE